MSKCSVLSLAMLLLVPGVMACNDEGADDSSQDNAGGDATATGGRGHDNRGGVDSSGGTSTGGASAGETGGTDLGGKVTQNPLENPEEGPAAGNPEGDCGAPAEAQLEDTSHPDRVVGDGSPTSCTSAAVVDAVAQGGVITFDCGPDPITITMEETAKIVNDTGPEIVLDGGGLVTLSGAGQRRILYMNTCDQAQKWTTDHCQNQDHPRLTVQNLTLTDGNARGEDPDGGGAIFVRGGRFKVINSRFFNNVCDETGPDVGGAAIRVLSQYDKQPVYVVNSTFGGAEGYGNECSNGGGISSIQVSWTVINSLFSHNAATGNGANPAQSGTPGGGSGGGIYMDGLDMVLRVCGTRIEDNTVNAHGGAIFFVDNSQNPNTSWIDIEDSVLRDNPGGSWYPNAPGISTHDVTPVNITNSTVEE